MNDAEAPTPLPQEVTEKVAETGKKIVEELSKPSGPQETQGLPDDPAKATGLMINCPKCGNPVRIFIQ